MSNKQNNKRGRPSKKEVEAREMVKQMKLQSFAISRIDSMATRIDNSRSTRYNNIRSQFETYGIRVPYYSPLDMKYSYDDFPFVLATAATSSPIHGAIINKKVEYTKGYGFDYDLITNNDFLSFANYVNSYGHNLNELLDLCARDLILYGGFALEVEYNHFGYIKEVKHLRLGAIRVCELNDCNQPIKYVYDNSLVEEISYGFKPIVKYYRPFNPSVMERLNSLDVESNIVLSPLEVENSRQIIYFKTKSTISTFHPSATLYPSPDYIESLKDILTSIQITEYNHNSIAKGVTGVSIITVEGNDSFDIRAKQELANQLQENIQGAKNAGGIVINVVDRNDTGNSFDIKTIEGINPDQYIQLNDIVNNNIIKTHQIPDMLIDSTTSTGWSDGAAELREAFNMFNNTVIAGYQTTLESVFNSLIASLGFEDIVLKIIPYSLDGRKSSISKENSEKENNTTSVSIETNIEESDDVNTNNSPTN